MHMYKIFDSQEEMSDTTIDQITCTHVEPTYSRKTHVTLVNQLDTTHCLVAGAPDHRKQH